MAIGLEWIKIGSPQ